ncbi:MAG: type II secretion system protein GspK, partial [Candidatus Scalindua sp.]|nr:type II secretion system protein GspK [Candidatus Scalindua sp.]MCR4344359.1 type II secretion system protein GspK [Candidatus Scalindua sp.]
GYVLVVIIGVLTILSLMTITFATLSRIETRATRNYTDSVKCEKIAKAGLEHAIYVLRLDKFGTDTTAYDSDPPDFYDENYDWSGETWMPGGGDFSGTDYDNDGDTTNDSQWIYFPASASTADIRLPGNLRARYAVLITDDREARVNINVTGNKAGGGSHTSNEGWSTFEIDLSDLIEREVGNGTTIANLIIGARHGTDILPGTTGNDDPGKIPDPQNDGIDNDGDSIVDEVLEDTDEPNEFNSIFPHGDDFPFGILSEAEIMGTSSYESKLEEQFTTGGISPEDQGAFKGYLTTYSTDTILCPPYLLDSGTSTTKLNINTLVNNEGSYTGGYYDSDIKVKMLIDVLTAGGVPDVERQQMAVNIKDFIDSDGTSTTYLDVSSGFTYYGVDKGTPYINEVEAQPSGSNPKFIELYNPYDENLPTTGGWTIRLDAGTTIIALPAASVPAGGYYVIGDSAAAGVDQVEPTITNLDSGGEELRLRDNNGIDVQVTGYGSAGDNDTRSLNDPRPIPLTTGDPLDPWSWATTGNSMGLPNDNLPAVDNDDGWDGATYPSSFFIANRRFSNKGYLGFIHRGRQWSSFKVDDTIAYPNVLQYFTVSDPSMDGIDNDGDGSTDSADTGSQSGDLDGPEYRIPGLINVNTAPSEVLQSLPNIGTSEASAIIGARTFTSIGEVANVFTGIPGNKWNREKLFRSISNLITTRSNVFTVYVTAQITDEAMSNVFAEKRLIAIVDRSVDPIKVRYFRWLVK